MTPKRPALPQATLESLHRSSWRRRSDGLEVIVRVPDPNEDKLAGPARGTDRLLLTTHNRSRRWSTSYAGLVRAYRNVEDLLDEELAEVIDG